MIKIAIVEDEQQFSNEILHNLKKFELDNGVEFDTTFFKDGIDIISDYNANFDIILLDIQMKHLDGMKTAELIRKVDEDVIIIFITSTVSFAVKGYEVDALGYILKPISYITFAQIIKKACKQIKQKSDVYYLNIKIETGIAKISTSNILYLESKGHDVFIYTNDNSVYKTSGPLKNFEKDLSDKGFFKCHSAYLINLKHVKDVLNSTTTMANNFSIPISRLRKKDFLENLTKHIGGV